MDLIKTLTPLHISCRLGLWTYARYFLNNGADVDATDVSTMTPLHHALLQNPSPFESGCYFEPGPDEIFETVKVLVELEQIKISKAGRGLFGKSLSQPVSVD